MEKVLYNCDFIIAGMVILFVLAFVIRFFYARNSIKNNKFRHFLISNMITCILDLISAYTITYASTVPVFVNMAVNTLYLAFAFFTGALITRYVFTSINYRNVIHDSIEKVVLFTYPICLVVNLLTGFIFTFENGRYVHGPCFIMNFAFPLYYVIDVLYILIARRRSFSRKQISLNWTIIVFPAICAVLQYFFPQYLLTSFSFCMITLVVLFSLETPDFIELEHLKRNLESEVKIKTEAIDWQVRLNKEFAFSVVEALTILIDEKDEYTKGHSRRVEKYTGIMADRLKFTEEEKRHIMISALLHDIGKIGIPDDILRNPNKLSDEQYEVIKEHTLKGYEVLQNVTAFPLAKEVALFHHERYDGKGYPKHIAGEMIPFEARIVSIVDSFDAMNSCRIYSEVLTREEVRRKLLEEKGKQFDPDLLDVFIQLLDEGLMD